LIGRTYVAMMVLVNATALMIYDLTGRFGSFHVASLISVATVTAGVIPVVRRQPRPGWVEMHGTFMCWSYVGLIAAFTAEIITRVPGIRFGPAVIAATGTVMVIGGILIHTRVPRILRRLPSPQVATKG
jgi:uncharacterized membrane protein